MSIAEFLCFPKDETNTENSAGQRLLGNQQANAVTWNCKGNTTKKSIVHWVTPAIKNEQVFILGHQSRVQERELQQAA